MEKNKCSMRQRYRYYKEQKQHQAFNGDFQQNFQQEFPNLSAWLKLQQKPSAKNQTATFSHWLILFLFGMLAVASFTQQLLLIGFFLILAALIKGPGMIVWGIVYSFLVSLFPPLGILLSGIFFLLSLQQMIRDRHFYLTALFFYAYPFLITTLHHFTQWNDMLLTTGGLAAGLISLHFLLKRHYTVNSSKALAWSLLSVPYDCLVFLIPSKKKKPSVKQSFSKPHFFRK